jgi:hypothetical protein
MDQRIAADRYLKDFPVVVRHYSSHRLLCLHSGRVRHITCDRLRMDSAH